MNELQFQLENMKKSTNKSITLPNIIICGYEHGGTTLLAEVFRSNGYESGFECGVLMCDTPKEFQNYKPYAEMLVKGWGIKPSDIPSICSGDFKNFYQALISKSSHPINSSVKFFDKTPIYMSKLGKVLSRTNFINKACVIHRDPRSVFTSWSKRVGEGKKIETTVLKHLENFCNRYVKYFLGCAAHFNNPDVLFIPFEEFCLRENFYYQTIGMFAEGKPFLPRQGNSRYVNVTGNKMDLSKVLEFNKHLSRETQRIILEKTRVASHFFAEAEERIRYSDCWKDRGGPRI